MGIVNKFATLVADKVNAKNDEVMSLTQENEKLQRELDASLVAIANREKRIKLCETVIEQSAKEYDKLENKLDSSVIEYNQLNKEYKRIKNNYDELSKKKPDKKLKKRNKELEEMLVKSENLIKANTIYRKTYECISDSKNKASVKDVFKHNLKLWMENENLSNVKAAELLDVSDSMIAEWKNGRTALTVKTIQEVDLKLCEYFKCSVYELVTVKMEGKKNEK